MAWVNNLIHVAFSESRGHVGWDDFFTTSRHPQGLAPSFSSQCSIYVHNAVGSIFCRVCNVSVQSVQVRGPLLACCAHGSVGEFRLHCNGR